MSFIFYLKFKVKFLFTKMNISMAVVRGSLSPPCAHTHTHESG